MSKDALREILEMMQDTKMLKEKFLVLLSAVKGRDVIDLLEAIRGSNLLKDYFSSLLGVVKYMRNDEDKADTFKALLEAMRSTDLLKENFSTLLSIAENIRYDDDYFRTFGDLLEVIQDTELLKENFQVLLNAVGNMKHNYDKIYTLVALIRAIRGSELINKFYSQIEVECATIVNIVENMGFPIQIQYAERVIYYYKERACKAILGAIQDTKLMETFGSRIEASCKVKFHPKFQEFKKNLPFTPSKIYKAYIFDKEYCIHEFKLSDEDVFFDDAGSEMYLSGENLINFFADHLSGGHKIEVHLNNDRLVSLYPNHFPYL